MKFTFTLMLFLVIIAYTNTAKAQTTFRNPVISGLASDPSICRVDDDYYLVTSTFEYFPGLPIYHSKDLVNWKLIGHALSRASNCPLTGCEASTGGNYAPTLRYHNGTFYVACTNYGGQGSKGQFYVTVTNPTGPWSDPVWVDNWYVDPSISFENDTMYYLTPNNNDGFLLGVMNPKTGKYYSQLKKIALGLGGPAPEGPHMYKINGYYYLMSAEGGTGYQHREVIQRSKSAWGPFEASPINPVVSNMNAPKSPFQAIGHADFVQFQDNSWWLVCLGFRPIGGNYHHLGRETFLAPVTWNADGWPKVGTDGVVNEEITAPNLAQHIWEKESIRDNFDSTSLRLAWNFVRNPYTADWSLTTKPGSLRLNGSAISFKQKDSPAFICRRQTAFNIVTSAKISFTPTASNEEAGLVIRGDDKNHFDFLITMLGDKRVIILRKYLQDKVISLNYKEIPAGDMILRISTTGLQYKFWVLQEGKTAELIGLALTKDLSTEMIGGFTGVFIGMYASGNGSRNTNPADFDWFDFEEEPTLPYDWATGTPEFQNNMETPKIISATSTSYDNAKIVWNNISSETSYIIERYDNNKFIPTGTTIANDTIFNDPGLSGNTLYMYRVIGKNSEGNSYPSVTASVLTLPAPGPYSGTPAPMPGKIEAENYDIGGNNVSYYDTDAGNNGGKYRTDDVDIESCTDGDNEFNIGWTGDGEWLMYTVNVKDTIADVELCVASANGGSVKLELDGKEIANTSIPATGGWQTWKTITLSNVKLEKGNNKKLKINYLKGGINLNWINFVKIIKTGFKDIKIEEIKVYPNPATDMLYVKSTIFQYSNIEIFNMEGKCLLSKTIDYQPENLIHFSLPEGQYLLSLNNLNQKRIIKFSIVQ